MTATSSLLVLAFLHSLWLFITIDSFSTVGISSLSLVKNKIDNKRNVNLKLTTDSPSSSKTESSPQNEEIKQSKPKTAIVVGCGPAGIATALILVRHHNYKKVTILESNTQSDISSYQRSKAYFYNLNERGQTLTKLFPNLQRSIEEKGVGISKFEIVLVPADPEQLYTGIPTSRPQTEEERVKFGRSYWIPRHTFMQCLLDEVKHDANIEILFDAKCGAINVDGEGQGDVTVQIGKSGDGTVLNANLVVGADGFRSTVREQLYTNPDRFAKWSNYNRNNFRLRQYNTPATGLRIKTLQINTNFSIPVGGPNTISNNSCTPSSLQSLYAIQSVNRGTSDQISISLLPVKDHSSVRPAAFCSLSNHDIWKIHTGEEMKAWFQKAFPRFDFESTTRNGNALVHEEEWDFFAKSQGTVFPLCQYCPGAVAFDDTRDVGILLVGDALHAFPPDIGQGVNAALRDVAVLDKCLQIQEENDNIQQKPKSSPLAETLHNFQKQRKGETKALIKLARFGAPFQYKQSSRSLTIQRYLWTMNILIRVLMNKFIGTPKPACMLMMDPSLSFQTIMKRCDCLTACLWSAVAVFVGFIFKAVRMRIMLA